MALGLFTVVHDEIKGPLIKDQFITAKIDIPSEFISKLYLSHAGFEESSLLEIKLNQYKVVSYYTGQKARIHKNEGILAILLEGNEEIENIELFLAKNISFALKISNTSILEKILNQNLPYFVYLNSSLKKYEIENITEIFVLKGKDTLESVLFYFGKSKPGYEQLGSLYAKVHFDEETPGIAWETISHEKSHYYLGIRSLKNTPDIEKCTEVLARYLGKSLHHCLEVIMMVLFPHSTLLLNGNDLRTASFFKDQMTIDKKIMNGAINLQDHLKKAENYQEAFENLITGLYQDELFPVFSEL
jgi:hypothetical protein